MSSFFVRRPIVAMVIAIITVIVGVVFLMGLPIALYPDITPPMIQVSATYTGANALNVEQSVATPLEQKINGVENALYLQSINTNDGGMKLRISFEVGTDPDMDNVLVQNRVSAATPKLPEDVKRLGVTTKKQFAFPVMLVSITSPGETYQGRFLENYVYINVLDELARIRGVGNADVIGSSEYSMRIWVKPDRLAQLGITIPEIKNAVESQNVIAPGGKFGDEPAPAGTDFTYVVKMKERLKTEEEFGDIVIRTHEDGSQVKIRDVARVELGSEFYTTKPRLNKKNTATVAIYQSPGSNALELSDEVRSTMEQLSKRFPADMKYDISLDTTAAINEGIHEIIKTLYEALILVILVVFLFLQNWRAMLIPTIAVPVSLLGAFIAFPLLGFSVNVLSLLGLVLAIGIVVDDAIVVVEAVMVHIEHGMEPKEATLQAMKEVSGPIVATTLVLSAVFIPVAMLGGIVGQMYSQFAITIAVSVLFSAINALTLSPALASILLKHPKPAKGIVGKFFGGFNRVFDRSTESYLGFAGVLTRKMKRGVVYLLVLAGMAVIFGRMIPAGFIPEEDMGYFMVNAQLPDASSLQRTDAVTKKVENILGEFHEIEFMTSIAGFSMLSAANSTNNAFIFVSLREWKERGADEGHVKSVMRRLNARFAKEIPEAKVFAFGPPAIPGLGNGSGFSMMLQDRGGNEPNYLAENTMRFIEAAGKRPEIGTVFTTFASSVPQRYLDIDREKAMKLGLSLKDVYYTVGAYLGGSYVNDFNRFSRLYKAYIMAEPEYRQSEKELGYFFVKNQDGEMVPLTSIATVKESSGPEYSYRFNLFRAAEVSGTPAKGYSSAQALKALEEVAAEVLPADMSYAWNAMSFQEKRASGTITVIFIFSLIFVFLILAAQYESWSTPLSILLGTPFALFGAFFGLWMARNFSESYEMNIFGQIALILLIALAAKNAILIVEFAKMKFDEGKSLVDAAIEAAKLRFRPILMTSFAFILGVIPLLTAEGAGAEARKVIGMAVFAGMLIATIIGVLMYPMMYVLIGKINKYEQKRDARILKEAEKQENHA